MNLMQQYHWLDVAIVTVIGIGALIGARRGVFRQTARLISYVVAFYLALPLHDPVEMLLRTHLTQVSPKVSKLQSFLATYLVTYIVTLIGMALVRKLLRALSRSEKGCAIEALGLKPLDRLLGAGMGMIAAALVVGGSLLALGSVEEPKVREAIAGSKLMAPVTQKMQQVIQAIPESVRQDALQSLQRLEAGARTIAAELAAEKLRNGTNYIGQIVK